MTSELLQILQHSLGLDQYAQPPEGYKSNSDDDFPGCYRNRFVTDISSPDGCKCQSLVEMGFMNDHGQQKGFGGMSLYSVTLAGYEAVKRESPPPPKMSRAKRRWMAFRSLQDATGITFREYLKWPGRRDFETFNLV